MLEGRLVGGWAKWVKDKHPRMEKVRYREDWNSRGNIVIIVIVVTHGSYTCREHSKSTVPSTTKIFSLFKTDQSRAIF